MSGEKLRVAFAATGVANLASIMAAFRRAGAQPYLAPSADDLAAAAFAVVPGVGSFGSAMEAIVKSGMDQAVRDRVKRQAPTMGVCAGMQLFFEASEESRGVAGMAIERGQLGRFPSTLPVPQLGWNRVKAAVPGSLSSNRDFQPLVRDGWAYFANSYRLSSVDQELAASWAEYGDSFVAAAEKPGLLLCQFHPELSGPWGQALIERWLKRGESERSGGQA